MLTRFLPPGVCHSAGWCTFLRACSAWPCHLQKGQQSRKFPNSILLLQADIISLHTLRLSVSLFASLRDSTSASSYLPSSSTRSTPATRPRSSPSWRWDECCDARCAIEAWTPAVCLCVCVCVCVCTLEYAPVRKGVHPAACALDSEWYQRRLYHNPQEL